MAELVPQQVTRVATVVTLNAAASGGDTFAAKTSTVVLLRNTSASPVTATITCGTYLGFDVADHVVTVPANSDVVLADLGLPLFKNTDGLVPISYSDAAAVTVAVLQPPLT